jgi:hypothetical protein
MSEQVAEWLLRLDISPSRVVPFSLSALCTIEIRSGSGVFWIREE